MKVVYVNKVDPKSINALLAKGYLVIYKELPKTKLVSQGNVLKLVEAAKEHLKG